METTADTFDMDVLLDGTLDDLADMPEFKPFPAGVHKVKINIEQKIIQTYPCFELKLTGIETKELPSGSKDEPLVAGHSTNVLYFMKHKNPQVAELGQGKLKELMKVFAEKYGAKSNRELIAEAQNSEVLIATGVREDKSKGKSYTEILSVMFE